MRQYKATADENAFSILALDDDPIMTSTVQAYFQRSGYRVDVENDPISAIERVRTGHYDILLLDFLMIPICGDQVVEEIRKFNQEIFIILLTGHKTMAPPIRTIRALDIQGYYEKSDRFDQLELLVESCVKAIRQMRTIRGYQDGLTSIVEALPDIYDLQSVEHILDNILQVVGQLADCEDRVLVLDMGRLGAATGGGDSKCMIRSTGQNTNLPDETRISYLMEELQRNGRLVEQGVMIFPLRNGTQNVIGFLSLGWENTPEQEQIQLMEVFTHQASVALSNVFLHALVQEKSAELNQAYGRLRDGYTEIVAAVRGIVDAKDFYTRNHSDRVSFYAVELAKRLGRDEQYCSRVKVAGLFHDIGKLGIPDEILLKADRLTDEEFEVIKTHSARGAELLYQLTYFKDIIPVIRAHHERYDGAGYPDRLAGEEIPEQARMIAVADAFDAMISDRRYRGSLGLKRSIAELKRGRGSQFDSAFVDAFVELVQQPDFLERAAGADYQIWHIDTKG